MVREKLNQLLVSIQLFGDGVSYTDTNYLELWPVFIKLNELKSSENDKVFLYGCFIGNNKPDPEFYLSELINELNSLYEYGLNIPKLVN